MSKLKASYENNFSAWYNEVVIKADLADYSPVRGSMVIKPYGYEIWEGIKSGLDRRFRETGHVNAYFPLFIPMSFLEKESKHVEGFAPQLAVVTIGGGKELKEPLVVRPTSETIIGHMYSKWIKSYRDLPVLINQWANVVRWELRTKLFLRTMEFLWQEGHTAHVSYEEAQNETLRMLDVYKDFANNDAAIPVFWGRKTKSETFAGALASYTIEAMMGDKRALQSGTSHNLGQNFARAFDIQYLDETDNLQYCWTTSWGVSTRMVGAIIMTHGDAKGLRLPPVLAPIQVAIVPIYRGEADKILVTSQAKALNEELKSAGVRSHYDGRDTITTGYKFNDWEMRGVPMRIEIGKKEVESGQITVVRRDIELPTARQLISRDNLSVHIKDLLKEIQTSLLDQAKKFRDSNVKEVVTYEDFQNTVQNGWALAWWCGNEACEMSINAETKATSRCIPMDRPNIEKEKSQHVCVRCGNPAEELVYFAKSY